MITRFNASNPCPICEGHPSLPTGQGRRCTGFLTEDYIHCTRENLAGSIQPTTAEPPTYAHIPTGPCHCGSTHGQALNLAPHIPLRESRRTAYTLTTPDGDTVTHERIDFTNGSKRFLWRRGDQSGLNGTSPLSLLYGSERLGDAPEVPVVICEGETPAEALTGLQMRVDVLGTVCGASHTPTDEALSVLAGRRVWLWPDLDGIGQSHMASIATSLHRIGAAAVHVITWGEQPKDDAADFVRRGGTAEDFVAIARGALRLEPGHASESWAAIPTETLEWLWYPYFPMGRLTILEGNGGIGKSFALLAIATAVTRGYGLPDSRPGEPGNVLFLSAEDGIGDTLRPRCEPMGANLERMFSIPQAFEFDEAGWKLLTERVERYRPRLIIFDPLFAFVGAKTDINRANQMRAHTARLFELAVKYGTAIIALRHLTKSNSTDAGTRGMGSVDIYAAARSVLLAGIDPTNPSRRAIAHTKCNYAPLGITQGYMIDNGQFLWTGASDLTAEEMLSGTRGADELVATREAVAWLEAVLETGPRSVASLVAEAKPLGWTQDTVRRAGAQVGVGFARVSGIWQWALRDKHGILQGTGTNEQQ